MENFLTETAAYYDAFSFEVQSRTDKRDYSRAFKAFLSLIPPHGTILDIGCGTGIHIEYFQSKGFQAFGIDPSQGMRRIALDKGLSVFNGNFLSIPPIINHYNGIWCAASFLHIPKCDAHKAVSILSKNLIKGGGLFITVRSGDKSGWDRWDRPNGILRRFIQEYEEIELLTLMKNAGIETIESWQEKSTWGRQAIWLSIIGRKK